MLTPCTLEADRARALMCMPRRMHTCTSRVRYRRHCVVARAMAKAKAKDELIVDFGEGPVQGQLNIDSNKILWSRYSY